MIIIKPGIVNFMSKTRILLVVLLTVFITSCEEKTRKKPSLDIQAELAGLDDTRNTFMKALKEKDFETLGSIVTTDVMTWSPGSEDWLSMYRLYPDRGPFPYDSLIMHPIETVIVSDSVAYDLGNSFVYYTDSLGNQIELRDTFLAILKKGKDGVWRLHREVASSKVN